MKAEEKIIYVPEFMLSLIAMDENKGGSISDLHYRLKISYAFLHNMKKLFLERGWISIQKEGLKHIPVITNKGRLVLNSIYNMLELLEIKKEDVFNHRILRRQQKVDIGKQVEKELLAMVNDNREVDFKVVNDDIIQVNIKDIGTEEMLELAEVFDKEQKDVDIEVIDGDEKDGTKKESSN